MSLRRRHDIWDVAIVGGGIAGLTAAWHAMRRGLATTLFEAQPQCGGQVATLNAIDDWPAPRPLSGVELAASLSAALSPEVVGLWYEPVVRVERDAGVPRVHTAQRSVRARRLIAASGARLRALGVPGEEALRGKGVSQCAHCDGHFFRHRAVAVIGGGDAALQEALVLAEYCAEVTIVSRSRLKARSAYVERAASKPNIRFVWDCEVAGLLGTQALTGLRLTHVRGGPSRELRCEGVFPFIGVEPDARYLPAAVRLDTQGRIVTDQQLRSSEPSIFAIGDARSGYSGDLVSAAGDAAAAVAAIVADVHA